MIPYKHYFGQRITTDCDVAADRAFLAHYSVKPAAASTTDILPFTKLSSAIQAGVLPAGAIPDVPRNVQVDANNSGVKKDIKVYGTNFAGEAIDETIKTNETTAAAGTKAFASITKIDLPTEHNAGAKHKSTVAVTKSTTAGTSALTFLSAATGKGYDIPCVFDATQAASTSAAATRIAAVLNADAKFAAAYTATASTANIILERKVNENSDATINLTVKDNGDGDLELGSINRDTQAGKCDEVSIGWGSSIGIPYKLAAAELVLLKLVDNAAESTPGTITADAADIEKNVYALHASTTIDGTKPIDLYIIV